MSEHPSRQLWSVHEPPEGYPAGVLPVPAPIRGTAFFPGGFGLWNPEGSLSLPAFPEGETMILGHDFHSETGYRASLLRGAERLSQPTWRNLLALLHRVGIRPEECFFTNAFMGLRAGAGTTGVFPGSVDRQFVGHCRQFLTRQLHFQRPSLVVTLGMQAPRILAALSPELEDWSTVRGIRHLDRIGPLRRDVSFGKVPDFRTTVVAVVHPSLRQLSVRHRSYRGHSGDAAEVNILLEARCGSARAG